MLVIYYPLYLSVYRFFVFFKLKKERNGETYNREAGVRMGSYGMTLLRNKPTALK